MVGSYNTMVPCECTFTLKLRVNKYKYEWKHAQRTYASEEELAQMKC